MFHVIVAATWPGNAAVNRPVIPLPSIYQCLTEWKAAEGKQTARCLPLLRLLVCWGYVSVCLWVFTWYLFICVGNNQTPPLLVAVFQHDSPASEEGQQGEGAPSRCRVSVTAVQLLHRSSSREDLARWVNHPPTSLVFMYSIWAAGDGLGTAESPLWPKGFAWLASIHHAWKVFEPDPGPGSVFCIWPCLTSDHLWVQNGKFSVGFQWNATFSKLLHLLCPWICSHTCVASRDAQYVVVFFSWYWWLLILACF